MVSLSASSSKASKGLSSFAEKFYLSTAGHAYLVDQFVVYHCQKHSSTSAFYQSGKKLLRFSDFKMSIMGLMKPGSVVVLALKLAAFSK
jgi:hypothetical protein